MDLTPPSFNTSPASPEQTYTRSPQCDPNSCCPPDSAASYPSPTLLEFQYRAASPYPSSIPEALLGDSSLPSLESMIHATWGPAPDAMTAASPPASVSSAAANLVSAEYDPFAAYDHCLPQSYASNDSYQASSNVAVLPRTPPPSTGTCARTPTPVTTREPFSYAQDPETQRIKNEGHGTYSPALEHANYSAAASMHAAYHGDGFPANPQTYVVDNPTQGWTKQEFEAAQLYTIPPAHQASMPHTNRRATGGTRPRRTSRKHTTREEANFQCEVKGCGKFFSRSYNFKSHMETHDDKREYPFPCPIKDCTKRFVRKTDLQRHHQSVHMKERNHRCDYCTRLFARKDTLRR